MTKLLVSVRNKDEAMEAVEGGADIVDVKNPEEGSLGASTPWNIKEVRRVVPKQVELSVAIGDLLNLPGTASLAALGAAVSGTNYVKAGLYGVAKLEEAICLMKNICRAVKEFDDSIKVVTVGYADFDRIESIPPILIPEVTYHSKSDIAMIDTAIKDGKTLFNFLNTKELSDFIQKTHDFGLLTALAGSLKIQYIPVLCELGVDIIGVRGITCTNGDRLSGEVKRELVEKITTLIRRYKL